MPVVTLVCTRRTDRPVLSYQLHVPLLLFSHHMGAPSLQEAYHAYHDASPSSEKEERWVEEPAACVNEYVHMYLVWRVEVG